MSEKTKAETPPAKSLDQHAEDLAAWLKERGLQPMVIARGVRTGAAAPIEDFMPDSHVATFALQPVQK